MKTPDGHEIIFEHEGGLYWLRWKRAIDPSKYPGHYSGQSSEQVLRGKRNLYYIIFQDVKMTNNVYMASNYSREKRTWAIIRRHSSASGSTCETSKNTERRPCQDVHAEGQNLSVLQVADPQQKLKSFTSSSPRRTSSSTRTASDGWERSTRRLV